MEEGSPNMATSCGGGGGGINCKYCNNGLGLDPCIKQYKVIISTSDDVTGHGRKNMKMGSAEARDETRSKLWHF